MAPTGNKSSGDNIKNSSQAKQNHERRKAATGIHAFTTQKGVTRSIQAFKHRKESKFAKKASLLREYHKVMKKEGLEAGRGKRLRDTLTNVRTDEDNQNANAFEKNEDHPPTDAHGLEEKNTSETAIAKDVWKRKPKMNPLAKSLRKASERKEEREQQVLLRQEEREDMKAKLIDRKRTAKLLSRRTKKGQPVMKNVITALLSKIEQKK